MSRQSVYSAETRELAKSLYLQGLIPSSIAQQLNITIGAVRGWRARFHWNDLRSKALQTANATPRSIAERSETIRATLAQTFERHAEQFAQIKTPNGAAALKLHEKAEPMVRNLSKVLGWEPGIQVASIVSLSTIDPAESPPNP